MAEKLFRHPLTGLDEVMPWALLYPALPASSTDSDDVYGSHFWDDSTPAASTVTAPFSRRASSRRRFR
jgi:hypothetical protein